MMIQIDNDSDDNNDHYAIRDSFDDNSFDDVTVPVLDVVDKTHTAFDLSPRASEYKDTHWDLSLDTCCLLLTIWLHRHLRSKLALPNNVAGETPQETLKLYILISSLQAVLEATYCPATVLQYILYLLNWCPYNTKPINVFLAS